MKIICWNLICIHYGDEPYVSLALFGFVMVLYCQFFLNVNVLNLPTDFQVFHRGGFCPIKSFSVTQFFSFPSRSRKIFDEESHAFIMKFIKQNSMWKWALNLHHFTQRYSQCTGYPQIRIYLPFWTHGDMFHVFICSTLFEDNSIWALLFAWRICLFIFNFCIPLLMSLAVWKIEEMYCRKNAKKAPCKSNIIIVGSVNGKNGSKVKMEEFNANRKCRKRWMKRVFAFVRHSKVHKCGVQRKWRNEGR